MSMNPWIGGVVLVSLLFGGIGIAMAGSEDQGSVPVAPSGTKELCGSCLVEAECGAGLSCEGADITKGISGSVNMRGQAGLQSAIPWVRRTFQIFLIGFSIFYLKSHW